MGKNKCGQRLTCDLGNKCWAADLKLQKQWWLASAPGGNREGYLVLQQHIFVDSFHRQINFFLFFAGMSKNT